MSNSNKAYTGTTSTDKFVDIMVVYTADVAGAIVDPAGEIQTRFDATNTMLAKSCVNFRYRLVHSAQVVHTENGAISLDLAALQDGTIAGVDALRATHGADLVQLWVETNSENSGGVGYAPTTTFDENSGFSVLYRPFSNDVTMAHELGHNLGLTHDRFQLSYGLYQSTTHMEGHGFVDINNKLESVMSYPSHCTSDGITCDDARVFSNPNKRTKGVPFGIKGYADSAGKLNKSFPYVAGYVASTSNVTVPSVSDDYCVDSSKNKDLHCFIATATFGSSLHPYLHVFRSFRDNILLTNPIGRQLVEWYYKYSPVWAKVIEESENLKEFARIILTPIAWALMYWKFMLGGLIFIALIRIRKIFLFTALIYLSLSSQDLYAQYTAPTLFQDDILVNPGATVWRPGSFFGMGVLTATSDANYDEGAAAEKRELGTSFKFAAVSSSISFEVEYSPSEIIRTRNSAPKFENNENTSPITDKC